MTLAAMNNLSPDSTSRNGDATNHRRRTGQFTRTAGATAIRSLARVAYGRAGSWNAELGTPRARGQDEEIDAHP